MTTEPEIEGEPKAARQNRGGRPRLAPDEVRSMILGVSVSARECRKIERLASARGMGSRPYMRAMALDPQSGGYRPTPPVFAVAEALAHLGNEMIRMARGEGEATPETLMRLADAAHGSALCIAGLIDAP